MISRRSFSLVSSLTFLSILLFKEVPSLNLSRNAERLLISLNEFEITEGAKLQDLLYISELSFNEFKFAIEELRFYSIINYNENIIVLMNSKKNYF